jgi:GT2 family glycosyltransferase
MSGSAVSVITPAYKTTKYIPEAIESALNQTAPPAEIIIVNDGCPDTENLEKALAPYADRIKYVRQENQGPGSARNHGIRLATSPFVAMLDSDDVWEPDYLAHNVAILAADPSIDIVYPNTTFFGETTEKRTCMEILPSEGPVTWESVLERRCNVVASVTARRESLLKAGLYDPDLAVGEDLALWLKILHQGGKIVYHRRPLIRYRVRGQSQTNSGIARNHEQVLIMFDRLEKELDLSPSELAALNRRKERERAQLYLEQGKEAFYRGDYEQASLQLSEANRTFQSTKLTLVVSFTRYAPWLLRQVVRLRDHYARSG